MKKYITKVAKDKIEELGEKWAINHIHKLRQLELEQNPETKKQIDSADHNMKLAEEQIAWYKKLLKNQG